MLNVIITQNNTKMQKQNFEPLIQQCADQHSKVVTSVIITFCITLVSDTSVEEIPCTPLNTASVHWGLQAFTNMQLSFNTLIWECHFGHYNT